MIHSKSLAASVSNSKRRGTREQRAVNGIHDWLCADLAPTEETAVEPFNGILPTLNAIEFEIDVALGIWI